MRMRGVDRNVPTDELSDLNQEAPAWTQSAKETSLTSELRAPPLAGSCFSNINWVVKGRLCLRNSAARP